MGKATVLFNMIPDGHSEPLKRPSNRYVDRVLRSMVEKANKTGDCIINVGNGYYRPIPGDLVDEKELDEYLNSELSRARKILHKRMCMRKAFLERRESGLFINHTG